MQDAEMTRMPETDAYYIRPRAANEIMKAAHNIRQTVYIYGACGYGKTSFAADYLSRRRYEYISMSDSGLETEVVTPAVEINAKKEHIVVVDDLHLITDPEEREQSFKVLHELAKNPNVWLILISRCPIPAWLKPLYIQYVFATIGERELSLTEKEEETYLENWNLSLTDKAAEQLKKLGGDGQPLCLRILALRLNQINVRVEDSSQRVKLELDAIEEGQKDLWDYLEHHVYAQWNVELLEFLMDISVVDRFDIQLAQFITKKMDAGRLICLAQETGNFLETYMDNGTEVYELRMPMRLSMRRRLMERCTRNHIDALYESVAGAYELQGNVLEALAMYKKCHNEEGISRILIENARKHAGTGYYWKLRKYYLEMPEDLVRQSPELMAGMSLLQSILLNDEESDKWYKELSEYAKTASGSEKTAAQARLFYLDIALPHRLEGQLTNIFKNAWVFIKKSKVILPEVSVTNNQPSMMNGGKDFCEWSKRDRELAKSIGVIIEPLLGKQGKGFISLALAESFFEKGEDNYEVAELAQKGRMQALAGGRQEMVFVAIGLLAWLSVINNHMENALDSLQSFRSGIENQPQLLAGVDTLNVRLLLYLGRSSEVADWMKQAPDEDAEFCTLDRYHYVAKVRVYLSMGKREKAMGLLQQLQIYARKRERIYMQIEVNILSAITLFRMGDGKWEEILQCAITQAEEYHFVRILSREGAALWELLKGSDFKWQDDGFKKQVFRECEQMAQCYPVYLNEKQEGNILLTDKALKVLRLQAEGYSVEQIGGILGLSKAGVKYYNQETYKKLGVSSKAAAITEARNRNII